LILHDNELEEMDMRQVIRLTLLLLAVSPLLLAADYRFAKIDVPNSISTEARGINARGDIVGSYTDANDVTHGFLLRNGVFSTIDVPGATGTLGARGINARGDIVGNFRDGASVQHGYLLRDGQFTQIDYPGASASFAGGIDNAGDITGSHFDAGGSESGFILKDGAFRNVHVPGSLSTGLYGAQDNGRVWVGQAQIQPDSGFRGFVRNKPGDFQLIVFPGFPCSVARRINQRGDIVGLFPDTDNVQECSEAPIHGFLLQDGEYTQIDFPRSTTTGALAINDDGVIVGLFEDRQGNTHGFKAVPKD
jgi:probable HAF family extracellular repeat protein